MTLLRIFAYGGGWQSNAALVLAAQGKLDYQTFLFCNVGDDSEDPLTLAYVRDHAMPYAKANGLDLQELSRIKRDGTTETILGRLTREGSRSLPIPVRMSNGAPGTRSCTADFKIKVIGKWAKQHGASAANPATIAIGISVDEIHRASNRREESYERVDYPLLDLRVRRSDCPEIIASAGLPMPAKSACWFCPMHRPSVWAEMRRDRPAVFIAAADLEDTLNRRRDMHGKDHVYLTRYGKPLREAIVAAQDTLFDDDSECDSGYCFT
jgi:hypothetical protein